MKKQNNTSMAHSAKPHKKRPFRLLALMAMLALAPALWAQDPGVQHPYPANVNNLPEWQGQNTGEFKITADSTKINSTVDVHSDGGTPCVLVLYPVGTPVVVKETTNAELFKVRDKGELHIIGRVGDTLKIYGNCGNGTATNPTPIPTRTNYQGSCILSIGTALKNPKIWLKYVEFYGFVTHTSINNNDGGNTGQGGIVTMGASASSVVGACHMKHVTFKNSYGGPVVTNHNKGYGRIISFVSGTWTVTLDNVKIHDCLISEYLHGGHESIGGMGSVIRSQGQVGGSLTMTNCEAYNNTYRDLSGSEHNSILDYKNMNQIKSKPLSGQGGVVNWRSGRQNNSGGNAFVSIQDCYFHHNSARCGGAVATCAFINMDGTEICYNEAEQGGGVYFYTYNGTDKPYDGHGFRATFEGGVDIHHNSASKYGGGAYLTFDASDDVGFTPSHEQNPEPMSPEFSLNINAGSTIHHNKAPKGAGIALMDGCPYSHYNNRDGHKMWSLEYQRTVNLNGGKIYDNYAKDTEGDNMAGGGIYIEKYEYSSGHPLVGFHTDYTDNPDATAHNNSGTLTVNLESGKVYNNSAGNDTIPGTGYGGGVYIASNFMTNTIKSTLNVNIGEVGEDLQMYENQAYTDGGGVYVGYDRTDGRKNEGTVTVKGGTIGKTNLDTGNKAITGNGGGICVMGGTVVVKGGNIEYNTAGELGGGIYVSVPTDASTTTVTDGANISRNTAKGGGGVYVDKGLLTINGPAFSSGDYGQNEANNDNTQTRITKNSASNGNGGGINAGNGTVNITNALIYNNTAQGTVSKGRGGGVYLDGGIINIVSSKILYNTAQTNGGGIDDHSGDIEIYGGDISHNTATNGRGGGIYTNAGDIRIWPSALYGNPVSAPSLNDCKNTGSVFSYNTAGTNGGGINTHIGRLDVRFAKVHHNVAGHNYETIGTQGGSGGGMFCEGPHADLSGYTVRLIYTDLNDNKAYGSGGSGHDLTGRGGGLYLKYGSIFAEHCDIIGNEADINGGGLDNHDGELRVYGSYVDENKALNGRGGGLFTQKGNLVVGPCDTYGFTKSKASRIYKNEAKINGGGINNHEGNIVIHGDRINENKAITGKGGGVYINSGNIFMYGGQINKNEAKDPSGGYGGGVYGGGGTFKIMERVPHPILEILGIDSISTDGFTVHFHHVDRGFAMEDGATDKEYGIAFSENPYPSNLGENVDWTGHWQDVTTVKVGPTNGTPIPPAPHSYNQYEGCSRFDVYSTTSGITITPNTTYYVVAYGKYRYDGKNYFDASPVVTVKTHGDLPVVVTGVGFDITTTSASVNGKLFYGGASPVTKKGIQIKKDGYEWEEEGKHESHSVGKVFSVTIEDLDANTKYIARAYATNSHGTAYGLETSFTTASGKMANATGNTPRSTYPAVEENPFFQELTPLQQAILASTPMGDSLSQTATRGGNANREGEDEMPVNIPEINYNTATYGGGICIDLDGANLIFAGSREANPDKLGQINYNYASEAGGGIYIGRESADKYAQMQMMGKCEVNYNRVPEGKHGGGIYLDGRFYVGDKDTDLIGTHGLKVDRNFAITKDQDVFEDEIAQIYDEPSTPEQQELIDEYSEAVNNIFLPRNEYDYYEHETANNPSPSTFNKISVLVLLSDISGYVDENNNGIIDNNETTPHSHIGFSVLNGFCPVIATSDKFGGDYNIHTDYATADPIHGSEEWLFNLMRMAGASDQGDQTIDAMRGAVFEDSESYVAVHTRRDKAPFCEKYIYLWGCWTHPIVMDDPEKDAPMEGSNNPANPSSDSRWKGHYVITNPGQNKKDGSGDPLVWEIYSAEGLSWFTSYVNGLNEFDEKNGDIDSDEDHHAWKRAQNPKAVAKIMNDLDMSAYLWVPIGSVQKFYMTALASQNNASLFVDSKTQVEKEAVGGGMEPDMDYTINAHYYEGTFDGQGHIIKGLQGLYLTGIKKFGLFGYLNGATIKNTFVDKGLFVSDDETIEYASGGIAGRMQQEDAEGPAPSISNSEARMRFDITYSKTGTHAGGLVGDMQAGSIHSCMAMPEFNTSTTTTDQYVGGLAGNMEENTTLKNSFANVLFTTLPNYKVGGIAGVNNGTIENVYVRYNNATNTPNISNEKFYWIAGLNKGSISYCFSPKDNTGSEKWDYTGPSSTDATMRRTYQPTHLVSGKYGFAHQDQDAETYGGDATTYIANGPIDNDGNLKGLLASLNNWVANNSGYTPWTRTMASTINDDYPVLMFNDFNVVGTEDGIYMKYDDNVNDMWKEPNPKSLDVAEKTGKNFQNLTAADNPKAAMYLYKTNGVTTANNSTPVAINVTENAVVPLHIEQNVGITQETGNEELTVRVGVTFDNTDCSIDLGGEKYDWHMFSSALKAAPLGITYQSSVTEDALGGKVYEIYNNRTYLSHNGITHTNYGNRDYMDPPVIKWNTEEGTVGYFPTNTPYGKWGGNGHWPSSGDFSNPTVEQPYSFDFYCFHEPSRHWINFKREGTPEFMDHWHQDIDGSGKHQNLRYENESTLQRGKGYMMGVSATSMLMADGILNNGQVKSQEPLSNSLYGFNMTGYSEDLRGINLVGNPYQSYLDFTELARATENAGIIYSETYYLFDADAKRYISYTAGASDNKPYAPRYIHPHQGFFIKTANNESQLTFTNAMRKETGDPSSYFRGQDLNYPLVNLFCYDGDGHYDLTTVEMNRPELGGGEKLKDMRFGNSLLYASMDDADYQTLFAPEGTSTVAVRFKASQNGVYTLRWETMHGDFQHLHLIDNLAGVDVDCMRQSEYRFEASTTDYLSRFKLVFDVTDVEENADEAESATFAFQMGDELVVNGSGELSVFDIQGRCIASQRLAGTQSSISLPRAASGMYILRLTGDKQVKTQKLIIK